MACACKVNADLDYLHKKYGHKIPTSKKSIIRFRVKEFFKNLLIYIVCIPIVPIMVFHVLFTAIFKKEKSINMKKILRLKTV